MEITVIGILCLAACIAVFARPHSWGLAVLGFVAPLGAAAAFNLWAVGGLSILCVQFVIIAYAGAFISRPRLLEALAAFSLRNRAVMLLLIFVVYAGFTSVLMPRIFAGIVDVYSLERPSGGVIRNLLSPLKPTTGNFTQPLYLLSEALLFALIAFLASARNGLRRAGLLLNTITAVHLLFAAVDALPGADVVLELIRTANYAIHQNHYIAGLNRIIGSYPEASTFGSASAVLFAYNFLRFLQTRGLWFLIASAATFACVIASLATTAYAVLGLLGIVWSVYIVFRLVRGGLAREHVIAVMMSSLVAIGLTAMLFFEPARNLAAEVYERLFGAKLESASGLERMRWNQQGLKNLLDTYGLGVGLGSAKTSSLAAALVSNTGVIGTLLYIGFLVSSFLRATPRRSAKTDPEAVLAVRLFVAARAAALAGLFGHLVSGGNVDAGVMFFIPAGVATGAAAHLRAEKTVKTLQSPHWRRAPVTYAGLGAKPPTLAGSLRPAYFPARGAKLFLRQSLRDLSRN